MLLQVFVAAVYLCICVQVSTANTCKVGEHVVDVPYGNATTIFSNLADQNTSRVVRGHLFSLIKRDAGSSVGTLYRATGDNISIGPSPSPGLASISKSQGMTRLLGIPVESASSLIESEPYANEIHATNEWVDLHSISIANQSTTKRWLIISQWVERLQSLSQHDNNGALRLNCISGCTGLFDGQHVGTSMSETDYLSIRPTSREGPRSDANGNDDDILTHSGSAAWLIEVKRGEAARIIIQGYNSRNATFLLEDAPAFALEALDGMAMRSAAAEAQTFPSPTYKSTDSISEVTIQSYNVSGTTSWTEAAAICTSEGQRLCSESHICATASPKLPIARSDYYGASRLPFGGMRGKNLWVPVSDAVNRWVGIGNYKTSERLCEKLDEPPWGMDNSVDLIFRSEVLCCSRKDVYMTTHSFIPAARPSHTFEHDSSKCREHTKDSVDPDCCGWPHETWCADGYDKIHGNGFSDECWPGRNGYRCIVPQSKQFAPETGNIPEYSMLYDFSEHVQSVQSVNCTGRNYGSCSASYPNIVTEDCRRRLLNPNAGAPYQYLGYVSIEGNAKYPNTAGAVYTFREDVTINGLRVGNHVNGCSGFSGTVDDISLGASHGVCQNIQDSELIDHQQCTFIFDSPQKGKVFQWWCSQAASQDLNGEFMIYRALPLSYINTIPPGKWLLVSNFAVRDESGISSWCSGNGCEYAPKYAPSQCKYWKHVFSGKNPLERSKINDPENKMGIFKVTSSDGNRVLYIYDKGGLMDAGCTYCWVTHSNDEATYPWCSTHNRMNSWTEMWSLHSDGDQHLAGNHHGGSSNGWILLHNGDTYNVNGQHPCYVGTDLSEIYICADHGDEMREGVIARVIGANRMAVGNGIFGAAEKGQCIDSSGGDVDHRGDVKLFSLQYKTLPHDTYDYYEAAESSLSHSVNTRNSYRQKQRENRGILDDVRQNILFINSSITQEGRDNCLAACENYAITHGLSQKALGQGPGCEMRPTQYPYGPLASCWILTSSGAMRGGEGAQTLEYRQKALQESNPDYAMAELESTPWYCWPALQKPSELNTNDKRSILGHTEMSKSQSNSIVAGTTSWLIETTAPQTEVHVQMKSYQNGNVEWIRSGSVQTSNYKFDPAAYLIKVSDDALMSHDMNTSVYVDNTSSHGDPYPNAKDYYEPKLENLASIERALMLLNFRAEVSPSGQDSLQVGISKIHESGRCHACPSGWWSGTVQMNDVQSVAISNQWRLRPTQVLDEHFPQTSKCKFMHEDIELMPSDVVGGCVGDTCNGGENCNDQGFQINVGSAMVATFPDQVAVTHVQCYANYEHANHGTDPSLSERGVRIAVEYRVSGSSQWALLPGVSYWDYRSNMGCQWYASPRGNSAEQKHSINYCQQCPHGYVSFASNSFKPCNACDAGKYFVNSFESCKTCPSGYFSSSNASHCDQCPSGKVAVDTNFTSERTSESTACEVCGGLPSRGGVFWNELTNACLQCPAGTYKLPGDNVMRTCTMCSAGRASSSVGATTNESCHACKAGTIADRRGSYKCKVCGAGKFTPNINAVRCIDCPPGKFNHWSGSDDEAEVSANFEKHHDSLSDCEICPSGKYNEEYGAKWCQDCPDGSEMRVSQNPDSSKHNNVNDCLFCNNHAVSDLKIDHQPDFSSCVRATRENVGNLSNKRALLSPRSTLLTRGPRNQLTVIRLTITHSKNPSSWSVHRIYPVVSHAYHGGNVWPVRSGGFGEASWKTTDRYCMGGQKRHTCNYCSTTNHYNHFSCSGYRSTDLYFESHYPTENAQSTFTYVYASPVTFEYVRVHNKDRGINCVKVEVQTSSGNFDLGNRCIAASSRTTRTSTHEGHPNTNEVIQGYSYNYSPCHETNGIAKNDFICKCGTNICSDYESGLFCHAKSNTCSASPIYSCPKNSRLSGRNIFPCICQNFGTQTADFCSSSKPFCDISSYQSGTEIKSIQTSYSATDYSFDSTGYPKLAFGEAEAYTVEAWVLSTTNTPQYQTIYASNSRNRNGFLHMELWEGHTFQCRFHGTNYLVKNLKKLVFNTWTHVACTRDEEGKMLAWVNGQAKEQASTGGFSSTAYAVTVDNAKLGRDPSSPSTYWFPGSIRSFRSTKGTSLYNDEAKIYDPPRGLTVCHNASNANCLVHDGGVITAKCVSRQFEEVVFDVIEKDWTCKNVVGLKVLIKQYNDGSSESIRSISDIAECADAVANDDGCSDEFIFDSSPAAIGVNSKQCCCLVPQTNCHRAEFSGVTRYRVRPEYKALEEGTTKMHPRAFKFT